MTLEHSTVARNHEGGAAIQAPDVFLTISTVAHNAPAPGIGEYSAGWAPIVFVRNSIVSDNGSPLRNCKSTLGFRYKGMNLANDYSCGNTTGIIVHDPRLLGLVDNGGPTMTEAFDYRSTALNSGAGCSVMVDQSLRAA